MQRERVRRQCGVEHEGREPAQDFRDVGSGDERNCRRRPEPFDDPMQDCAEQRRLVFEAVVEGALRDPCPLRDRFDARGAVAAREEQLGRGVENAVGELRRFVARRAAAAAACWRGACEGTGLPSCVWPQAPR
jgi:hypothetical protein